MEESAFLKQPSFYTRAIRTRDDLQSATEFPQPSNQVLTLHRANACGCDDRTISLCLPRHLKCERQSSECDEIPANKRTRSWLELECSPGGFRAKGRTVLGKAQSPRVKASQGFCYSGFIHPTNKQTKRDRNKQTNKQTLLQERQLHNLSLFTPSLKMRAAIFSINL